ncbi:MAG: YicC/YloC family endoribonuclease [Myxococcota bacterium]
MSHDDRRQPVFSMTGFGTGRALVPGVGDVDVEVRSVNHKHLDLRVHVAERLAAFALFVEQQARARVTRGRYDVRVRVEARGDALEIDRPRARRAWAELTALRDELAPDAPLPLSLLGTVPDLFRGAGLVRAEVEGLLRGALDASFGELEAMRRHEGAALETEVQRLLGAIRERQREVRTHAVDVAERHRDRLRRRIAELRADTVPGLDEGRLETEVALLAERADITEELTRLDAHATQAETRLRGGGAVGRRLDFLGQEMGREINTIGSKTHDATVAHLVVALKADVARLREQGQNLG